MARLNWVALVSVGVEIVDCVKEEEEGSDEEEPLLETKHIAERGEGFLHFN